MKFNEPECKLEVRVIPTKPKSIQVVVELEMVTMLEGTN
jgi:hypothetical protein